MSDRKPYAIYAITRHGIEIAKRLSGCLPGADVFVSEKLFAGAPHGAIPLPLPVGQVLADSFCRYDCHVFIISVGAVVRMIAPLLRNKKVDPAVVCVDDAARFAICVLSGHVGRGNTFTERIGSALNAQPVITTASDAIGTLTVDILGREQRWTLDDPDRNITRGCAAVVNAQPVLFVQEAGEPDWWPLHKPLPEGVTFSTLLDGVNPENYEILLIASDRDLKTSHPHHWQNAVLYRPKSLVLGLGCDRGIDAELVERGIESVLMRHGLSAKSVKSIATVTKKSDEPAFLELSARRSWPMQLYTGEELDAVSGIENPSKTVQRFVGTRGVAEPAALKASGAARLLVPKQIYTEPGAGRSMTVAVARIPFPARTQEGTHE
jgi:cobalt-precorrin 5A hydrolase